MSRFGCNSTEIIDQQIIENVPRNTVKSKTYVWKQFTNFCEERKYELKVDTTTEHLAFIMKDFAFNMRKIDGNDYKESVVKTIWNTTAKLLQEKYFSEFGRSFDPFKDLLFQSARMAQDSKRKLLQATPEKRKTSSTAMTPEEYNSMCLQWDENTPTGLQKKFFLIAAVELAWRGNEGALCILQHFKDEVDNKGSLTNRIEYSPIFTKTHQGGG